MGTHFGSRLVTEIVLIFSACGLGRISSSFNLFDSFNPLDLHDFVSLFYYVCRVVSDSLIVTLSYSWMIHFAGD